jgi:hypothetical protein
MGLITRQILNNASSQAPSPFQIFAFKRTENEEYYLQVQPGTVNGILPSNIIGTNTLQTFTYSKDQINYVILECKTNGQYINSASIKVQNSVPAVQIPVAWGLPATVQVLIGGVYNTITYQVTNTSISLGVKVAYVLNSQDNASLPFVPYYIWG